MGAATEMWTLRSRAGGGERRSGRAWEVTAKHGVFRSCQVEGQGKAVR